MTTDPRLAAVELLLFDVDGVLTDGTILLHADGTESKRFHIRDGSGIVLAQRAGLRVGLLSGRSSDATTRRAAQLAIPIVVQGADDKLAAYEQILRQTGCEDRQVAYMGDDVLDLPVLERAGFSAAPADAPAEIRERVDWISAQRGGGGAARELIELVLKGQDRWSAATRAYLKGS
ncbi:MAG TPA: HAD hydrolase family protein [Vicinamibacterales bacterium]|nr:HAD hydrolase family protein [Vicinamibacterales bacterium]